MNNAVIKKIDELGRIVIPKEVRKYLDIKEQNKLSISIENDSIVLRKIGNYKNIETISKLISELGYGVLKKNIIITKEEEILSVTGSIEKNIDKNYVNIDKLKEKYNLYIEELNSVKVIVLSNKSNIENIDKLLCKEILNFIIKYLEG